MPKVSVVMAVYNGERYLRETVESLLGQSYADFELIIVDDASTDNTGSILDEFKKIDPRVRVIRNEVNSERSASRNKGIALASGEYVAMSDADDISVATRLETQVRFLDQNNDISLVGTGFVYIDATGKEISLFEPPSGNTGDIVHFLCNPSIMFRKNCADTVGLFREALVPAEDYDFSLRVADRFGISTIREPLYKYRVHDHSSTSRESEEMNLSGCLAIELQEERRRLGKDSLDGQDKEAAIALRQKKSELTETSKKRALSRLYTVWGRAACNLRSYSLATTYAVRAARKQPSNLWAYFLLIRILFSNFTYRVIQWSYPSRYIREHCRNGRTQDIDENRGECSIESQVLANIISTLKPRSLLDVGCGSGSLFPLYKDIREVVIQHASARILEIARGWGPSRKTAFVCCPATNLAYPPEHFDLIVSNRVLQYLPAKDVDETIRKLTEIGRRVYLNEMTETDCSNKISFQYRHDYPALLARYGFRVEKTGMIGTQTWRLFCKDTGKAAGHA